VWQAVRLRVLDEESAQLEILFMMLIFNIIVIEGPTRSEAFGACGPRRGTGSTERYLASVCH
jgi:hypothetical protein